MVLSRLTRFIPQIVRPKISSFSVRTRIFAIALVPVIGFVVNGVAYVLGQSDVDEAIDSARQAALLSSASRELKAGLGLIRSSAREFAIRSRPNLIKAFNDGHARALENLNTIQQYVNSDQARLISPLRLMVSDLKRNFDELVGSVNALGVEQNEGLQGQLQTAADDIEKII